MYRQQIIFLFFWKRINETEKHRPRKDQRANFFSLKSIKPRNHCVYFLNFHLRKSNRTLPEQGRASTLVISENWGQHICKTKITKLNRQILKSSSRYKCHVLLAYQMSIDIFIIYAAIRLNTVCTLSVKIIENIKTRNVSSAKRVLHLQQDNFLTVDIFSTA